MTMTVKPIKRKEQAPMDLDPKVQKPDMELESPRFKEQEPEPGIQDHTHPEYDQMMVMMQEMQAELSQIKQQNGVEVWIMMKTM